MLLFSQQLPSIMISVTHSWRFVSFINNVLGFVQVKLKQFETICFSVVTIFDYHETITLQKHMPKMKLLLNV